MDQLKFDEKKYSARIDEAKISFKKEINELNTMIIEEIGEENKHFYRISLITELIEKDLNMYIDEFSLMVDLYKKLNNAIDSVNKIKDIKDYEKEEEYVDPVSKIVGEFNILDDENKRHLLSYVSGYVHAYKKSIS